MKSVVIVEDNPNDSERLSGFVKQFFNSISERVEIHVFNNSLDALDNYTCHEDIIFLDIDLPYLNGLELAKKIREKDEGVIIIFCSNLAQYALKGYEVSAFDYIVKPFNYNNIEHRLSRAMNAKDDRFNSRIILKIGPSDNVIVDCNTIIYVEKDKNYLIFHTTKQDYKVRGSLQEYESVLPKELFSYCMKGVYVNLSHVETTTADHVVVKGVQLPFARGRKKAFIADLFSFFDNKFGDS